MPVGHTKQRGFTLVEMLVVLGIFTIITTLVLARNTQFTRNIAITNLAYDVALAIREAQVFGLSVRQVPGQTGNFSAAYGMHFEQGESTFSLFADLDEDNQFDELSEEVETFSMQDGFTIRQLCGSASGIECNLVDEAVDILFERPDPEARIIARKNGALNYVEIEIGSDAAGERTITVMTTGQITIKND